MKNPNRNRNRLLSSKRRANNAHKITMNTTLGELYKGAICVKNPHCLVELSEVEWRRMEPNSIRINSKSIQMIDGKRIYHYNDIKYGTNVNTIKRIKNKRGYTEHFLEIEL